MRGKGKIELLRLPTELLRQGPRPFNLTGQHGYFLKSTFDIDLEFMGMKSHDTGCILIWAVGSPFERPKGPATGHIGGTGGRSQT